MLITDERCGLMTKEEKWWLSSPDSLREGIGVVLHWKPTGWTVHRAIDGSPAARAGIQQGDVVYSINGYELGTKDDIREAFTVSARASAAKGSDCQWTYVLVRNGKQQSEEIKPSVLRSLIEHESTTGNAMHDYCYSCYECYMETSGWANCGHSGCSVRCVVT